MNNKGISVGFLATFSYLSHFLVVLSTQHISVEYFLALSEAIDLLQQLHNPTLTPFIYLTFTFLTPFSPNTPQLFDSAVQLPENIISQSLRSESHQFADLSEERVLRLWLWRGWLFSDSWLVGSAIAWDVGHFANLPVFVYLGRSLLSFQSVDFILQVSDVLIQLLDFNPQLLILRLNWSINFKDFI